VILFKTKIYSWVDERDSSNRVGKVSINRPASGTLYRSFILNPYLMSDIKTATQGSTFQYSDNFGDRREKPSTIICDKTVAQLKAYADTTANSNTVKLPIYKNNNRNNATTDTTILWSNIVYCDRYNPNPENTCWVVYTSGSFKRKEVLVALAIEDVSRLVASGNTTRTSRTEIDFPGM
jgi:hypothetical protein